MPHNDQLDVLFDAIVIELRALNKTLEKINDQIAKWDSESGAAGCLAVKNYGQ
jgi:hypothetical protein